MNRIIGILAFFTIIGLAPTPVISQEVATIADINQVDDQGNPIFPGLQTMDQYTIQGRVLNEPGVFDGFTDSGDLSGDFILFVQDDTGGIQVYSGAWYGGGLSAYPDELQPGHLVTVTGLTGHFGGKTNVNERHNPDQKFTIEAATTPPQEPAPFELDSLAGLNDFDPTRQSGGEYYQGRLVTVKNVQIVEGEWAPAASLTVADDQGNTLTVELRAGTGIGDEPRPEGALDITGVFNQEDPEPPFTEGYLLWPRSIDDFQSADGASHAENWDVYR
ncbi:MAG: hypothetical protein JXR73_17745 [Candidatus Omnitrophica bacterium]|nr:hypothetical protein [Candidatus Omnitrophota bacterium]